MGTRNLIAVVKDGKFVVGQYCEGDGYPEGQGKIALEFLRGDGNVHRLTEGLQHVTYPTEDERKAFWKKAGHDGESDWVTMEVSQKFRGLYPSLSRDTGAGVLGLIAQAANDNKVPLVLQQSFAGDSLFCEWAYVIDLDQSTFEVYRGFNKEPTPANSRFPSGADWLEKENEYEPVKLLQSYWLRTLPSVEDFVADLNALAYPDEENVA